MNNTSINFTSFTQEILNHLQEKLGENYAVFSHRVRKNNGVELTGIVAGRKGYNTSPTIYIDSFYREGITKKEIKEIAGRLYDEFQAVEFESNLDLSGFAEFEKAKEKLSFKLISMEKNKELLKEIPHKKFYNLAIVFFYTVQEPPFCGKASILVYNNHVRQWGSSVEELLKIACENTPILFPCEIENMENVMKKMLSDGLLGDLARMKESKTEGELFDGAWLDEMSEQMAEGFLKDRIPMYVLTNKQKLYGAACMLYPGILKGFSEKMGEDLYVLPSSVHEVILVPISAGADRESLREIVTDINRTQVAEEEVLADSVYYYSRKSDRLVWIS